MQARGCEGELCGHKLYGVVDDDKPRFLQESSCAVQQQPFSSPARILGVQKPHESI